MSYHPANPNMGPDKGSRIATIGTGYGTGTGHEAPTHVHQLTPGSMAAGLGHADATNLGGIMSQFSNLSLPGAGMPTFGQGSFMHQDGTMLIPNIGSGMHPMNMTPDQFAAAYHGTAPYLGQPGFTATYMGYPAAVVPYTPGRTPTYLDRTDSRGNRDVPPLENRRGSYSTTESTPATPFFGSSSEGSKGPRVTVVDRSAYTTPSPQQMAMSGMFGQPAKKEKILALPLDPKIEDLLEREPPIPRAIPALFTPRENMKSLEQCLENRIPGNKNVYIRGLHPTTDDELLLRYAKRFGPVDQSKAIIDTATGACKGFGFAKFEDIVDSEKCIRGFYHLGYEVGFARESFNARLKAEGDDNSTNLYISNLPKSLTENELGVIFNGYTILSSKILRDGMGNSRGVGFARFQSRDVCEEVIQKFHGLGIGEEGMQMQVRYADTPAQKELKRVTAERRQFRTNEYNIGAYGTAAVGLGPNVYSGWNRRYNSSSSGTGGYRTNHTNGLGVHTDGADGLGDQSGGQGTATKPELSTPAADASSDDGSGDEGVTIVETPVVANGSSQSSPCVKKEKD